MVQVPASYDLPTLSYRMQYWSTGSALYLVLYYISNTPSRLELIRTLTLSSVLPCIACANVVHMLFE